jgi:phosphatidylglycerol:prolipoprotein diacylglycerol transferase
MHPVLCDIGGFPIKVYGIIVATAFLTAIYLASVLAGKEGFKKDVITDLGIVSIIGAVIGSRLVYVAVWWQYFAHHIAEIFMLWQGGLVFYGGFIGAVLGCWWWINKHKLPFFRLGDICAPFIALAHSIGRIGCFFNGCCYGFVDTKHGIVFPGAGDNLPHFPIQLVESALNFMNFIVLMLVYKNKGKADGRVFSLYFLNYGVIRFTLEFFRGDTERGTILFISTSQFISIFMVAAGIAGLIYTWKKEKSLKQV